MKPTVVVGAVAVLLIGYLLYRLGLGDLNADGGGPLH